MRNYNLREFRVRVNWRSPIWQVWVPIRQVITPIRGHLHPIRQVVPQISQVLSYSPYRSHLHLPSLSFSSTTPPSLQEHNVKSSLSISPCHHHELTPSAAYTECCIHRVQHTLSEAYTECSIHRVKHTASTAYTRDCLSSLHSHNFVLTPECSFSFRRTSLQIDCHQPVLHLNFRGKVTSSHSHGCEITN